MQTVAWPYDMKGNEKVEQLYTKFQILAWMIINSSRKKSNQLENCQKFGHKLS